MADIKISELTTLATMTDSVIVPVVDGASTKKITGLSLKTYFLNGNAATVTNGVVTTESYSDPSWITSLSYSKLVNFPITVIRAQHVASINPADGGKWTFTTIKG